MTLAFKTGEVCQTKNRLIEDLREASRQIFAISDRETTALLSGDMESLLELEAFVLGAREKWDAAIGELKRHIEEHRC